MKQYRHLLTPWNLAGAALLGSFLAAAGILDALHHVAAAFGAGHLFTGCVMGLAAGGLVYAVGRRVTTSRATTRQRLARQAAHAARRARHTAALATIEDPVARVAVACLADIDRLGHARQIWCSRALGLGHEATAHHPAAYPTLYSTDTDPGFRAIPTGVELSVRLAADHADTAAFIAKLPTLASILYLDQIRHAGVDRGVHTIHIITRDPLADAVALLWPEEPAHRGDYVDLLAALRVGMREDGEFLRMRLRGDHMLIAGVTGAGKSSALWSLLAALGPAIRDEVVAVHMIDLKRGMEMAAGHRLYENFAYQVDPALALLETLVTTVLAVRADARRQESMRTGIPHRKHIPHPGDPHHVLVIDELMALLKIPGKRTVEVMDEDGNTVKIRIVELAAVLLIELLTQARAIGLSVVMATQNAAKEVLELLRDLIPSLVGMRLPSDQEQMVFGRGARDQGVRAAEITADQAGTLYIKTEDGRVLRGRFFHVTDESIPHIVRIYGRTDRGEFVPDPHADDFVDLDASDETTTTHPGPGPATHHDRFRRTDSTTEHATTRLDPATAAGEIATDEAPTDARPVTAPQDDHSTCDRPGCSNPRRRNTHGPPARFCSDKCRQRYHNARRSRRPATHTSTSEPEPGDQTPATVTTLRAQTTQLREFLAHTRPDTTPPRREPR